MVKLPLILIVLSAVSETIWTVFLKKSKGLTDWSTNAIGIIFLLGATILFKKSLDLMPLSVATIIWNCVSLIITIVLDIIIFKAKIDLRTAFFMGLCITSIIGLNYTSTR